MNRLSRMISTRDKIVQKITQTMFPYTCENYYSTIVAPSSSEKDKTFVLRAASNVMLAAKEDKKCQWNEYVVMFPQDEHILGLCFDEKKKDVICPIINL